MPVAVDRPDDIGEQFPSDADAVAQPDPTAGRQQYDYETGPEPRTARAQAAAASEGTGQALKHLLKVVNDDDYTAVSYIGGVEGAFVQIAKPWFLRRSLFDGEEVDGYTYEYLSNVLRKKTDEDSNVLFEELVPPYIPDLEQLLAMEVDDTGLVGISLEDLNTGQHRWQLITNIRRAVINDTDDDILICQELDINDNPIGDEIDIAKAYKLQRTPWDGTTIVAYGGQSIEYTYTDEFVREAELIGGSFAGDKQTEIVVPAYGDGDIILFTQPANGTGIAGVSFQDLNADGRAWVRYEVTT